MNSTNNVEAALLAPKASAKSVMREDLRFFSRQYPTFCPESQAGKLDGYGEPSKLPSALAGVPLSPRLANSPNHFIQQGSEHKRRRG
jgi:hypothetical protein